MADTVVYTGAKLAAEVVKLKQEVAELRTTIQHLADFIGATTTITQTRESLEALKPLDDGWGHAEDGWPWDVTELGCTCKWHRNLAQAVGSTVGWWCPVHKRVSRGLHCWQQVF